jgi:hypothetical protein
MTRPISFEVYHRYVGWLAAEGTLLADGTIRSLDGQIYTLGDSVREIDIAHADTIPPPSHLR